MDTSEKITATFGDFGLDHEFFSYLHPAEKDTIQLDLDAKRSHVVSFKNGKGELLCLTVIDIHPHLIHINQMGGKLRNRRGNFALIFAEAFAAHLKRPLVTFCTAHKGIKIVAEKAGYRLNEYGDYQKAV